MDGEFDVRDISRSLGGEQVNESGDSLFEAHPGLILAVEETEGGERRVMLDYHAGEPRLAVQDGTLIWALAQLPKGAATKADIERRWLGELDVTEARELWSFCIRSQLIRAAGEDGVRRLGKGASAYHAATRAYPFLDMSQVDSVERDNAIMQEYNNERQPPGVYLDLRYRCLVAMEDGSLRSSHTIDPLESLLATVSGCFAERGHRAANFDTASNVLQLEFLYKAVPSGGGRHPTECFVVPSGIRGLRDGVLYHYSVRQNGLGLLGGVGASVLNALDRSLESAGAAKPRALLLLASRVERAMWRYREPRSARAVAADAGHCDGLLACLAQYYGAQYFTLGAADRAARYQWTQEVACLTGIVSDHLPVIALGVAAWPSARG